MADTTPTRGELAPGAGNEVKDKAALLASALAHADEAWKQEFDNVSSGRDCQRFYVGGEAQWDTAALTKRKAANRPVLTMNRGPSFVRQLTGEVMQNPPGIKVLPSKDGATVEAAEIFNGLIRNIEQQSIARAAYTKAAANAAQAGIGGWRVQARSTGLTSSTVSFAPALSQAARSRATSSTVCSQGSKPSLPPLGRFSAIHCSADCSGIWCGTNAPTSTWSRTASV
jgi:hypothetical protein